MGRWFETVERTMPSLLEDRGDKEGNGRGWQVTTFEKWHWVVVNGTGGEALLWYEIAPLKFDGGGHRRESQRKRIAAKLNFNLDLSVLARLR